MRMSATAVLSLVTVVMTGCHPERVLTAKAIGVTVDRSGYPMLVYILCPAEAMKFVQLYEDNGGVIVGGPEDDLIWQADWTRPAQGESTIRIVVVGPGHIPPGFEETPLPRISQASSQRYEFSFSTTRAHGIGAGPFVVNDLRRGSVLSNGHYLSISRLRVQGSRKCTAGTPVSGGSENSSP